MTNDTVAPAPARGHRAPGPRGFGFIVALREFKRKRVVYFEDAARRYGDVVAFHCPGFKAYLVTRPEFIHHVLVDRADNYVKSPGSRRTQRFFGRSLQMSSGAYARSQRQTLGATLHRERVGEYAETVARATSAMLDAWETGATCNAADAIMRLVLDMGIQTHFGTAPGEESARIRNPFLDSFHRLDAFLGLPAWVPTRRNRQYGRAIDALDAEVFACIAARRRAPRAGGDVLSSLLDARNAAGEPMSDRQLRDELVSLLAASYFTVAAALIHIVRLVALHPDVEARLAGEIDSWLGERLPTSADLRRLVVTEQVVREALRVCPPAGALVRQVVADDRLGHWHIPAGARVVVSPWVMQHRADVFDEPYAFKPERWTPGFERTLPAFAYFPFGVGARNCIGQALAMMQLQLMLAMITQRFRLEPLHPAPTVQIIDDLLESGFHVRFHARDPRRLMAQ